jgi:hypothetical protein
MATWGADAEPGNQNHDERETGCLKKIRSVCRKSRMIGRPFPATNFLSAVRIPVGMMGT